MSRTYTTKAGDMLDLICYRHYAGKQSGALEAVLEANQPIGLSDLPAILPAGITMTLPDLPSEQSALERQMTKLWD